MADLGNIVYISSKDLEELKNNGTIEVNGIEYTYDENDIYCTPYEDDLGIILGSSAPSIGTVAEQLGQLYFDTSGRVAYQCIGIDSVFNRYTWRKIIGENDLATKDKLGIIKLGSGLEKSSDNFCTLENPSTSEIEGKNTVKAILTKNIDQAVKVGITTNTISLTEDERNAAKEWLGITNGGGDSSELAASVAAIEAKIPTQASPSNQLADKDFVNSSINSLAAFYITSDANGKPFASHAALIGASVYYSGGEVRTPSRNDYALVTSDETHNNVAARYIYENGWEYQFKINDTPFTAEQVAVLSSGITATKVAAYDAYAGQIAAKQDQLVSGTNIKTVNGYSIVGSGNVDISIPNIVYSETEPSAPVEGMIWLKPAE